MLMSLLLSLENTAELCIAANGILITLAASLSVVFVCLKMMLS